MPVQTSIQGPAEDPASSIIDRAPQGVFPGLDLDVDIMDPLLGDDLFALIEALTFALLDHERVADATVGELYVRIVANDEMQTLNRDHRGKDKPTNVLSFQAIETDLLPNALIGAAKGGPPVMLGDIIIAAPVVVDEAQAQNKLPLHHFAHLIIHGLLHLLGHDHMEDEEAEIMEEKERAVLAGLGINDPYAAIMD